MGLGTKIRMARLFPYPLGNLSGVAVDNFVGYGSACEGGLKILAAKGNRCMTALLDPMTVTPGTARHCWLEHAGRASPIVQASCSTSNDGLREQ